MSILDNPDQLRQQELLNPNQRRCGVGCSSSEDEEESMVAHKLTPDGIGAAQTPATSAKRKNEPNPLTTPLVEEGEDQPESLEECQQQQQEREDSDILDTRLTPEYTFLQSCDDLILEISMPTRRGGDHMLINLEENDLDLRTSLYRLKLPLPHPVDIRRSQGDYDGELWKLRLTLISKNK